MNLLLKILSLLLLYSLSSNAQFIKNYEGGNGIIAKNENIPHVRELSSGGYLLTGMKSSDIYLVKTNGKGDTLWTKTYGSTDFDEFAVSFTETNSGDYMILAIKNNGSTFLDAILLMKVNSEGDSLWAKEISWNDIQTPRDIKQTSDGGFVIAGSENGTGTGKWDLFLLKVDEQGNEVWRQRYGGGAYDYGNWVEETADGGFIYAGRTISFSADGSSYDFYLVKTDAVGNIQWEKSYGDTLQNSAYCVKSTPDNGFILVGVSGETEQETYDIFIVKVDENGDTLWSRIVDSGVDSIDIAYAVDVTSDENYIIAAKTGSAVESLPQLIKLNTSGNIMWSKKFNIPTLVDIQFSQRNEISLQETTDLGYIIAVCDWNNNYYLIKTNKEGEITSTNFIPTPAKNNFYIYPNPVKNTLTISSLLSEGDKREINFVLYNLLGQKVKEQPLRSKETTIDIFGLPQGVYLYDIHGQKGKIMILSP